MTLRGNEGVEDIELVEMGDGLFATIQHTEDGTRERTIWTREQAEEFAETLGFVPAVAVAA